MRENVFNWIVVHGRNIVNLLTIGVVIRLWQHQLLHLSLEVSEEVLEVSSLDKLTNIFPKTQPPGSRGRHKFLSDFAMAVLLHCQSKKFY